MQNDRVLISEKKLISKFFKNSEISSIEPLSYVFTGRKKIILHSPPENADRIANAMHKVGAGKIGDYLNCSFRVEGIGTYKPGLKSTPHKGKRGKLSKEKEVKLEIECGEEILNEVIDAMLGVHPYEEVAYEIHEFSKRENKSDGSIINLVNKIHYPELLNRINKKITPKIYPPMKIKRVAIKEGIENEIYIRKSRLKKADAVIFVSNKINLIII